MPLNKSKGQMYNWITHTHCHLGGECPHKCRYCYVDNPRFGRPEKYRGSLRLIEDEFLVSYGAGKTVFIENCNDLFAAEVPDLFIFRILKHCQEFPKSTYVFQSKNPARFLDFLPYFPVNSILGTTIETNRDMSEISKAPPSRDRAEVMMKIPPEFKRFVTVEPVLDFDEDEMSMWIFLINPHFLNLGADSKDHGLPEPSVEKIHRLTAKLAEYGIELREKHNLKRLVP